MSAHLPAWKRLGLKLKTAPEPASESALDSIPPDASEPSKIVHWSGTKRRFDDDDDVTSSIAASSHNAVGKKKKSSKHSGSVDGLKAQNRNGKRQKVADLPLQSRLEGKELPNGAAVDVSLSGPSNGDVLPKRIRNESKRAKQSSPDSSQEENASRIRSALTPEHGSRHKRQKSVSFTPDTKREDGDSTKRLTKGWIEPHERNGEAPAALELTTENGWEEVFGAEDTRDKVTKREKRKTRKDQKAASNGEANGGAPPYVEYLQQYHTDRSNWKFNKVRQTDLLKNIFNLWRIPFNYDDAIVEYIAGLQGKAARERLIGTATDIIDGSGESAPSDHANGQNSESSEEARRKEEQKLRAQKVVKILQETKVHFLVTPETSEEKLLDTQPTQLPLKEEQRISHRKTKRKRKHKQRKEASSDEESSSDSSSDED